MKDCSINIRISKEDLNKIKENAQQTQMTTTAYLTKRGLDDEKIIILEDLKPIAMSIEK